jgi:hypothetical protein
MEKLLFCIFLIRKTNGKYAMMDHGTILLCEENFYLKKRAAATKRQRKKGHIRNAR